MFLVSSFSWYSPDHSSSQHSVLPFIRYQSLEVLWTFRGLSLNETDIHHWLWVKSFLIDYSIKSQCHYRWDFGRQTNGLILHIMICLFVFLFMSLLVLICSFLRTWTEFWRKNLKFSGRGRVSVLLFESHSV